MLPLRYFLATLLLMGTLGACSRTPSGAEAAGPAQRKTGPAYAVVIDVPVLVGRTIDQVRRVLGPPQETRSQKVGLEPTPAQLKATNGEDWINTFVRDNTTLVVTFNARTRKVRDLVVIGTDEDEILQKANLTLTAARYVVLPVANPRNQREIVGMRVVQR